MMRTTSPWSTYGPSWMPYRTCEICAPYLCHFFLGADARLDHLEDDAGGLDCLGLSPFDFTLGLEEELKEGKGTDRTPDLRAIAEASDHSSPETDPS